MTKLKFIILAGLAMFNIHQSCAQYGTGNVFNPNLKMAKAEKPSGLGFSADMPASYSLKMYTPYVKSQGIYGSCAGWAVSYEALSIQSAIANNMTDRNHITAKAFCPYYSYNKQNPGDFGCSRGADPGDLMLTLLSEGGKKFYLPLLGCGSNVTDEFSYAAMYYKIKDARKLAVWPTEVTYDPNDVAGTWKKFFAAPHLLDINYVKSLISSNYPVVISMALPNSFTNCNGVWEPTAEEKADPAVAISDNNGGHRFHAMTIVGYDDKKNGGSFEVMNSWSEAWGNNGYFWVKYDDLKMYVYGAYYMKLFPSAEDVATKTGAVWGDCLNGYGFYRFDNGQTYEGQFKDGYYNGYGVYTWPNGQAHAGQWKVGKRDGEATCYYQGGTFGQAIFANDAFVSGYNELFGTTGESYKGYLKNGKFEGYGEYRFPTGERYLGMWSGGVLSGLVKHFGADGSTFIGYYSDGKRNGKGLDVTADGKLTAGEWLYGIYQSGKKFGFAGGKALAAKAEMSSDLYLAADCVSGNCLTGEGKRVTGGGTTYTGTFVDGLEDGKGEKVYTNGTYNGSWRQGETQGIGEFKFTNGVTYISEFKKGQVDGYILKFDGSGNMAVELYNSGELVKGFTEISTAPPAGTTKNKPAAFAAIPTTVSSVK